MPYMDRVPEVETKRPSREQMIADLTREPSAPKMPSREQMIMDLIQEKPSAGESFLTGAASGATFGTSPVAAGLGAGAGTLYSNIAEQDIPVSDALKNAWQAFKEGRMERNEFEEFARRANPKAFTAGTIGGGLATAPLLPAQTITKGAPLATKLAQGAKTGGQAGAIYGAGTAAGSAEDPIDALMRVGGGAAIGAGSGAAMTGLAEGAKAGAGKLKDLLARYKAAQADKQRVTGTIKPETPREARQVLQSEIEQIRPSEKTEAQNKLYKELGLEPLTPIQQQPKAYGEPTPSQYAETLLKSRDPKLYEQQLKQVESYEKVLDKFRLLGDENREAAGQRLIENVEKARKGAGKEIGEFKQAIAPTRIRKDEIPRFSKPQLANYPLKDPYTDKAMTLGDRLSKARSFKDIDDIASDLGAAVSERGKTRAGIEASNYKKKIENYIETFFPEGKPREAYRQYAKVKEIYRGSMKNILDPKAADSVVNKITATGGTYKQFKKMAEAFDNQEMIDLVKDNYISQIFNSKNWKLAWEKAAKNEALKEIVPKDVINRVNTLLKYDNQMRSTMTSTVNPPRSGIINTVSDWAKKPIKDMAIDLVWGDGRQYRQLLKQYESITKPVATSPTYDLPLRGIRGVAGREALREMTEE